MDRERTEEGSSLEDNPVAASRGGAALTPAVLRLLRRHVVNLEGGRFGQRGKFSSQARDVDEIFQAHLPRWISERPGQPLRLLFWAHGGLVPERDGLEVARAQVQWWVKNGVYPIYFVWETGFGDALRTILGGVGAKLRGRRARDFWDHTTDPLVEAGARALGGVHIWGAMKTTAERACAPQGGARYVAEKLSAFCKQAQVPIALHAAGHSAGSIFHAHFLNAAKQAGAPAFDALQVLAPAIRVDAFKQHLLPLLGDYVKRLSMFTMDRHYEEADNCIGIYRKSLLYLIHHALEAESRTPVLGLELSVNHDAELRTLFGLDGRGGQHAEVIWSVTDDLIGRSASRARAHQDFDDDASTMGSVAARVLGANVPLVPYNATSIRARGAWPSSEHWLEPFDLTGLGIPAASGPTPSAPLPSAPTAAVGAASPGGRRVALCVGIDAYPGSSALQGCVADAKRWASTLANLGFRCTELLDARASYDGILRQLEQLIGEASAGDSVVFQFAGHGTQLADPDGDEDEGYDEALVPCDFESGAMLCDDDLREVLLKLKPGVSVTCFLDCCHSGTATRLLMRNAGGPVQRGRSRFLKLRAGERRALWAKHLEFRASGGGARQRTRAFGNDQMAWFSFAACRDHEVAYEHDGQGDFTRIATALLARRARELTRAAFRDAVIAEFGPQRVQTPQFDGPPGSESAPLFAS